jgi:hypothetical protein
MHVLLISFHFRAVFLSAPLSHRSLNEWATKESEWKIQLAEEKMNKGRYQEDIPIELTICDCY